MYSRGRNSYEYWYKVTHFRNYIATFTIDISIYIHNGVAAILIKPFYCNFVAEDNSSTWFGSDRDYTYDELLSRVFEIILDKNPDMAAGRKPKFVMRPPQVLRVGTKKTSFANFTDICKTLHRQPKHLLDFLLAELGTSGSMDGNQQLIIKGRFQPKQIENVLRR